MAIIKKYDKEGVETTIHTGINIHSDNELHNKNLPASTRHPKPISIAEINRKGKQAKLFDTEIINNITVIKINDNEAK